MNPGLPGHKPNADTVSPAASSSPGSSLPLFSTPIQPPQIPDHELLRLIGRGAYGEVWMARNAIGTLRAVKIVHRQSFLKAEHFEREFNGLLKFEPISRSHDGLVDVLQIGRRDEAGHFYYVMELADDVNAERSDGEIEASNSEKRHPIQNSNTPRLQDPGSYAPHTLRSELQLHASLPPAECVTLGVKLSSALEHLHANGLVHRDIKPSNIIFVKGEPKLADIGLVTAIDEAQSFVGTAGYIPPEGLGTPQADIFALGKVLYEIAFGKDRQEFPELPPDLESNSDYAALLELNEVILKSCETDPRRRYANATSLVQDLTLLQHGQSVKQARMRARRWKVARQLALVMLALALVGTTATFMNRTTHGHTPNPEAMREYELGRWHYNQLTPEHHKMAIEHLSRALELDPGFVQPYRELSALYIWGQPGIFNSAEEREHKVKEIADDVIGIDPNLAEGHAALSYYRFLMHDWDGAEREIVRAIELDPNYQVARDVYAFYLSMLGRADEAQVQAQRSQELDPTARTSAMIAAWPYMANRQFDKAIAQLQRVIELDKNFAEAYNFLGRCYEAQRNYVAAIEAWRSYDLLVGHDPARVKASYDALREAYDSGGEAGYSRKYLELIHENEPFPEAERIFFPEDSVGYYARLGENAKALDALEKYFDFNRHRLKFEPDFDPLRQEPRFKALLKKAGLEK